MWRRIKTSDFLVSILFFFKFWSLLFVSDTDQTVFNRSDRPDLIFQSTHPEADELNVFLSDDKLRSVSGIDSDQEQDSSVTAVEQEALQLANNFKGAGHNFASVTIDKNNIFLGATVKNDDAKVVISRIVAGGAVENDGRLQEGKNYKNIFKNFIKTGELS